MTQQNIYRERARIAKDRRDLLARDGYCINGQSHGKATNGILCAWCRAVHTYGLSKVLSDPDAPSRPAGYVLRLRDVTPIR